MAWSERRLGTAAHHPRGTRRSLKRPRGPKAMLSRSSCVRCHACWQPLRCVVPGSRTAQPPLQLGVGALVMDQC